MPLRLGAWKGFPLLSFLFYVVKKGSAVQSGKRRNKISKLARKKLKSLYLDDMIIYEENPVESIKKQQQKTPELIKEFSKPVKYKTDEQISILSPYTRSEKSETGIFKILQYKKNYIGINLTKDVKERPIDWKLQSTV